MCCRDQERKRGSVCRDVRGKHKTKKFCAIKRLFFFLSNVSYFCYRISCSNRNTNNFSSQLWKSLLLEQSASKIYTKDNLPSKERYSSIWNSANPKSFFIKIFVREINFSLYLSQTTVFIASNIISSTQKLYCIQLN